MVKKSKQIKQFIIRKYVMAYSAKDAIRKEKALTADDVWVNDEWTKNNVVQSTFVGFNTKKK